MDSSDLPEDSLIDRIMSGIFGEGWIDLATGGSGDGAANIILTIIHGMNTVALVGVGVIFLWLLLMGLVGTGTEGKPMGSKYNTVSTPIRVVLGFGFLMPLAGGLSIAQMLVLSGVALSSYLTNEYVYFPALEFIEDNHGAFIPQAPTRVDRNAQSVADSAMRYAILRHHLRNDQSLDFESGGAGDFSSEWIAEVTTEVRDDTIEDRMSEFYGVETTSSSRSGGPGSVDEVNLVGPIDEPDDFDPTENHVEHRIARFAEPKSLGNGIEVKNQTPEAGLGAAEASETIEDVDDLPERDHEIGIIGGFQIPCNSPVVCDRRTAALDALLTEIEPFAADFIDQPGDTDNEGFNDAIIAYNDTMMADFGDVVDEEVPVLEETVEDFVDTGKSFGWPTAGLWYWTISGFNERVRNAEFAEISRSQGNLQALQPTLTDDYHNLLTAYEDRNEQMVYEAMGAATGFDQVPSIESDAVGWLDTVFNYAFQPVGEAIARATTKSLALEGDPVATMSGIGSAIVSSTEVVVATVVAARMAGGAAGKGSEGGLVSNVPIIGQGIQGAGGALHALTRYLSMIVLVIAVPVMMLAFFLAFYLPAIPLLVWFSALVGWVVQVIESIVAAVLWGVIAALPDQDSSLLYSSARQGLMLYLGIIIRPPLMVLALFVAMVLLHVIGGLAFFAGHLYMSAAYADRPMGFLATLAVIAVIGLLMIQAVHRIFDMIPQLPRNIMNFIGGPGGENLGESGDRQEGRSILAGGIMSVSQQGVGTARKQMEKGSGGGQNSGGSHLPARGSGGGGDSGGDGSGGDGGGPGGGGPTGGNTGGGVRNQGRAASDGAEASPKSDRNPTED